MTDWIKVRAEELRQAERIKKETRDGEIKAGNELRAKIEPFWNELLSVLDQSAKQFNIEFPEAERRIDQCEKMGPTVMTIRRSNYPAVTVKVQLNNAGTSAQYSITRTKRKGMDMIEEQATFSFEESGGKVGYAGAALISHDDVARLFLEPFFEF